MKVSTRERIGVSVTMFFVLILMISVLIIYEKKITQQEGVIFSTQSLTGDVWTGDIDDVGKNIVDDTKPIDGETKDDSSPQDGNGRDDATDAWAVDQPKDDTIIDDKEDSGDSIENDTSDTDNIPDEQVWWVWYELFPICGAPHGQELASLDPFGNPLTINDANLCAVGELSEFVHNQWRGRRWTCIAEWKMVACSAKEIDPSGIEDEQPVEDEPDNQPDDTQQPTEEETNNQDEQAQDEPDKETVVEEEIPDQQEEESSWVVAESCWDKNGLILYDEVLVSTTPWLCTDGPLSLSNFFYDSDTQLRTWMCSWPSWMQECSALFTWCGDSIVNGGEQCDGSDSVCGVGSSCEESCTCSLSAASSATDTTTTSSSSSSSVSPEGECGSKDGDVHYAFDQDINWLSATSAGLCDEGTVSSFTYSDSTRRWVWSCVWWWSSESCNASLTRCGDGLTSSSEQCDDGNTIWGDGCSASCLAESSVSLWPVVSEGCGDGNIDSGEQCDDWNRLDEDGCDATCEIESGRKCTQWSPSQCGTLECFTHGERYTESNIWWTCCGWLESFSFNQWLDKVIGNETSITICYDRDQWVPQCQLQSNPTWRYVDEDLVLEDSCEDMYKDYFTIISEFLEKDNGYCQYTDANYAAVDFKDLYATDEDTSVMALEDFCIVKWIWPSLSRYGPNQNITRAEFVKMLVKTIFLWYEFQVQPEERVYQWETHYVDVTGIDRFAQYVAKAYELNLLRSLSKVDEYGDEHFMPHKSMSVDDVVTVLDRVDIGQQMDEDLMKEYLGSKTYPKRDDVAALIVRKFTDKFVPYFYLQWENRTYVEVLAEQLKGKRYEDQYMIILDQIELLQGDEELLAWLLPEDQDTLSTYWILQYLEELLQA